MIRKFVGLLIAASLPISLATADLSSYSQNFEGMGTANSDSDTSALDLDGWQVNGTVWQNPVGTRTNFVGFYGNFPAPNYNGNPGFSGVVADQGTGGQGNRHLNIYSDYANGDVHPGPSANWLDARVFQEQTIGTVDLGTTHFLSYEYKRNNESDGAGGFTDFGPTGDTRTFAFIRVLDNNGTTFPTLGEVVFETTTLAQLNTWNSARIELLIDNAWDGDLLQFGFFSEAHDNNNSGVLYDNVNFSQIPEPGSFALLGLLGVGLVARRRRR